MRKLKKPLEDIPALRELAERIIAYDEAYPNMTGDDGGMEVVSVA